MENNEQNKKKIDKSRPLVEILNLTKEYKNKKADLKKQYEEIKKENAEIKKIRKKINEFIKPKCPKKVDH